MNPKRLLKLIRNRTSNLRSQGVPVWLAPFAAVALTLNGCGSSSPTYDLTPTGNATITLTSPAFQQGQFIPKDYACTVPDDSSGTSPALQWTDPPEGTKSLALIMDDPDVKGMVWVHWVLYGLPPTARSLPEGVQPAAEGPEGSRQGNNSWEKLGYGGPCPPTGTHRYFFRLYALDTEIDLPSGATADQLREKMQKHVLAVGELMGTYGE